MNSFICPEIEIIGDKRIILKSLANAYDSKRKKYNKNGYTYQNFIYMRENLTDLYLYLTKNGLLLLNEFKKSNSLKTMSQFATEAGITILDYSDVSTYQFQFYFQKLLDLKSPFFYTVYTDDGIVLMPTRHTGNYKGIVSKSNVINEIRQSDLTINLQGETTGDYFIYPSVNLISPVRLNTTLKSIFLNKYKSMNNVIQFQSIQKIGLGDYVKYDRFNYVILSKIETIEMKGTYIYTAVKEVLDTNTFITSDSLLIDSYITDLGGFAVRYRSLANLTRGEVVNQSEIGGAGGPDRYCYGTPTSSTKPLGSVENLTVANAEDVFVVVSGIGYLKPEAAVAASRGYLALTSTTEAGRVSSHLNVVTIPDRFQKVGVFIENGAAGVSVLADICKN